VEQDDEPHEGEEPGGGGDGRAADEALDLRLDFYPRELDLLPDDEGRPFGDLVERLRKRALVVRSQGV